MTIFVKSSEEMHMPYDTDELREKMKQECYGAYFAGGYGGALMESFEIDQASSDQIKRMAGERDITVDESICAFRKSL